MQPLARDGLSTEQVTRLVTSSSPTVSAGCELLRADLSVAADISDDLESGSVTQQLYATIHRACTLRLARELVWGVDLVRPFMVLSAEGMTVRVNVGVFALTTPERQVGESPVTYEVSGFDRVMLLARQVGSTYTIPAVVGTVPTTYRKALLDTFAAAGLTGVLVEGAAADDVLPVARTWPLVGTNEADPDQTTTPATWLRVINDLLRAISFRAVYADENGLYRCESYRDPATRAPEFTFDADDLATIVGEARTVTQDVWRTPNRWVFRWTNRPGGMADVEGDGKYTRTNQSDGPTSIDARRLTWTEVIDYEAASQAKLQDLGNRRVAIDRQATKQLKYPTGPFPFAGHADVFTVRDVAAEVSVKVQATGWSFDLAGSDVRWDWEAVL